MKKYIEPIKELNIAKEYDVIVCGGGPAGVCAAISAARMGVKTALVEAMGCIGGIWTAGLMPWVIDCNNKGGIMKEISDRIIKNGFGKIARGNALVADAEGMKFLLEEMCLEAGVDIRLHTSIVGAVRNGDTLEQIITESKSGREVWSAEVFIDCTGDGDVGAFAGCGFDIGKPGTGEMQPMSLIALVSGLKEEEIREYNNSLPYTDKISPKKKLLKLMEEAGISPSYRSPSLFHVKDDLFLFMTNQEYKVSGINADDLTKATLNARKEIHLIVNALKNLGGVWKDMQIVSTAEKIGVREGRRIHGLYKVTDADLVNGIKHDDSVCRVTFGFDLHSVSFEKSHLEGKQAKPYDIPMGALIAKDVKGLLMAGRCISGDFLAHSSYRVTGNAAALGEAAGRIASAAVKYNLSTYEISFKDIKQ